MSTEAIFSRGLVYTLAKGAVALWALLTLGTHVIHWVGALLGDSLPDWLTIQYGATESSGQWSGVIFVITSVVAALLLIALWHGYQALRRLEQPANDYAEVVHHLARFATALFLYSAGKFIAAILVETLSNMERTGQFNLVLLVDIDQITLLLFSVILYFVCNALRAATEAVEENQSFL